MFQLEIIFHNSNGYKSPLHIKMYRINKKLEIIRNTNNVGISVISVIFYDNN